MIMATRTTRKDQRLGRFFERRDDRDFPFYDGRPIEVPSWRWLIVVVGCVAGFFALATIPAANNVGELFPRSLFTGIMLVVFILMVGRNWTAIFKKPTGADWVAMLVYAALTLAVSAILATVVRAFSATASNPATDGLAAGGAPEITAFYVGTAIQLLGEELFSVLPFLALMYVLYSKLKFSRGTSIIVAWLVVAVWFGAAHLPTYGWNVAQALIVIGGARLVLTLAYIRTKNIWVSTGAHIINDWAGFTFVLVTTSALSV
jgi:membrane protease YdiL (CAAX protease family)